MDDLEQAQVFVLNGEIPYPNFVAHRVEQGTGLVLILSLNLTKEQVAGTGGRLSKVRAI